MREPAADMNLKLCVSFKPSNVSRQFEKISWNIDSFIDAAIGPQISPPKSVLSECISSRGSDASAPMLGCRNNKI